MTASELVKRSANSCESPGRRIPSDSGRRASRCSSNDGAPCGGGGRRRADAAAAPAASACSGLTLTFLALLFLGADPGGIPLPVGRSRPYSLGITSSRTATRRRFRGALCVRAVGGTGRGLGVGSSGIGSNPSGAPSTSIGPQLMLRSQRPRLLGVSEGSCSAWSSGRPPYHAIQLSWPESPAPRVSYLRFGSQQFSD